MGSFEKWWLVAVLLAGCAHAPVKSALTDTPLVSTTHEQATARELVARADATVFVFWSSGCPCVRRYQSRIEALAQEWKARGVAFVQVSSNAGESLELLEEAARSRGLALPLWRDERGELAEALGARSTPTVVFVRRDGELLYRGWLDNEREAGELDREPWLEHALNGFLTGQPFASRSPTWGCTITRRLSLSVAPSCHTPGVTP